jgi:hypothetical protein
MKKMSKAPMPGPDEKAGEKEEFKKILVETLQKHALDIESLAQNVESIKTQLSGIPGLVESTVTNTINGIIQNQNSSANMSAPSASVAPQSLKGLIASNPEQVGNIIDKVLNRALGQAEPTNFLGLDEDYIKEKMKNSIMGNFELGESLIEAVKAGFKRKTVGKMVSNVVEHGIE